MPRQPEDGKVVKKNGPELWRKQEENKKWPNWSEKEVRRPQNQANRISQSKNREKAQMGTYKRKGKVQKATRIGREWK